MGWGFGSPWERVLKEGAVSCTERFSDPRHDAAAARGNGVGAEAGHCQPPPPAKGLIAPRVVPPTHFRSLSMDDAPSLQCNILHHIHAIRCPSMDEVYGIRNETRCRGFNLVARPLFPDPARLRVAYKGG